MNRRYAPAALALGLLLGISCGGETRQSTAGAGAGAGAGNAGAGNTGNAAGASACGSTPVPKEHRAVAQACPSERGSSEPVDMTVCTNRAGITCTKDADCTAGMNGRCIAHNYDPCDTACSYDECLTDSDCAAGSCLCRSGGTDALSNQCLPNSNCKTDVDCGNCGYCSPSAAPVGLNCNIGPLTYMCHTANDQCTDPSDCDGGYCAYDLATGRWACGSCVPFPRP